jgi:hypothetical protein
VTTSCPHCGKPVVIMVQGVSLAHPPVASAPRDPSLPDPRKTEWPPPAYRCGKPDTSRWGIWLTIAYLAFCVLVFLLAWARGRL